MSRLLGVCTVLTQRIRPHLWFRCAIFSGIAETRWFTLAQTGSQRDSLHHRCRTAKVCPQGAHGERLALRCAFLLISLAWVWCDSHTAALCSLSVWGIHQKMFSPFLSSFAPGLDSLPLSEQVSQRCFPACLPAHEPPRLSSAAAELTHCTANFRYCAFVFFRPFSKLAVSLALL